MRTAPRELAPRGATMIRLCRFSGANARRPLTLVASIDVRSHVVVADLVRELNRLPPMPTPVSCPSDDLAQIALLLSYPKHRSLTIGVELSGCQTVTNGTAYRTAAKGGGPRLISEMKRLVSLH